MRGGDANDRKQSRTISDDVGSGGRENRKEQSMNDSRMKIEFFLSDIFREVKWSHDGVHWHSAAIESLIQAYEQQIKYLVKEQDNG